jgi:ribulose 1,5-bisphosphate synthetase/thiazole synthase
MTDIAIVGAGPYGLSVAAHLRGRGRAVRIFGEPLETWRFRVPGGMFLKSDGFASSLSAPEPGGALGDYCAATGQPYHPTDLPVPLETFLAYGLEFQRRFAPEVEARNVTRVERAPGGFRLELDDGERLEARRVVLAVGITHFHESPRVLADLPEALSTHARSHNSFEAFAGRDVTVIGAGATAVEVAVSLGEAGARARLVARTPALKFSSKSLGGGRSLWSRIRHPSSGLGPGVRSRLACDVPDAFRFLPADTRLEVVRRHLGPSSPYHLRPRLDAAAEVLCGRSLAGAAEHNGQVALKLAGADGASEAILTDHVISATGYRADVSRLAFLEPSVRAAIRTVGGAPVLSTGFESSVPGLHFTGLAAAASFGPLMRFMFGADFAARRLAARLAGPPR